jgi:tRNA (guanine-N7-)-methyltransferase
MPERSPLRRPVRSFVRREGRTTAAQKRALAELYPRYGLSPGDSLIDFAAAFGRAAPVALEIGFGNGDALARQAAAHPETDYLGIEVHRPGVGRLLARLAAEGLANVRVVCADAKEVLARNIPDESLAAVYVLFPDPWPKKRHHKRRLVQPEFAQLVRRKLKPGGVLHLATDWPAYAEHMETVLNAAEGFAPAEAAARPGTKYEARGRRLGHPVRDLAYARVG